MRSVTLTRTQISYRELFFDASQLISHIVCFKSILLMAKTLSLSASPKSILTIIDQLIDWAEAVLIPEQSAATVARVFNVKLIARCSVLDQLHLNREVQFESTMFADFCATFGIDKTQTTF